ncbi:MAG: nuclear transport factor 2 family protein [Candidatus Tectomicrobia bacterium]|nr:nuclear transport factor 2 family protein [Candidatus Tectomicrobia bacterium]
MSNDVRTIRAETSPEIDQDMLSAEREIGHWFSQLEKAVNAADYELGKTLFVQDVVAFGTRSHVVTGLENLMTNQWMGVWPFIKHFRFNNDLKARIVNNHAWAVITWDSQGFRPDGTPFPRPGRATLIFEKREERWLAVHSHFSLFPAAI